MTERLQENIKSILGGNAIILTNPQGDYFCRAAYYRGSPVPAGTVDSRLTNMLSVFGAEFGKDRYGRGQYQPRPFGSDQEEINDIVYLEVLVQGRHVKPTELLPDVELIHGYVHDDDKGVYVQAIRAKQAADRIKQVLCSPIRIPSQP